MMDRSLPALKSGRIPIDAWMRSHTDVRERILAATKADATIEHRLLRAITVQSQLLLEFMDKVDVLLAHNGGQAEPEIDYSPIEQRVMGVVQGKKWWLKSQIDDVIGHPVSDIVDELLQNGVIETNKRGRYRRMLPVAPYHSGSIPDGGGNF